MAPSMSYNLKCIFLVYLSSSLSFSSDFIDELVLNSKDFSICEQGISPNSSVIMCFGSNFFCHFLFLSVRPLLFVNEKDAFLTFESLFLSVIFVRFDLIGYLCLMLKILNCLVYHHNGLSALFILYVIPSKI